MNETKSPPQMEPDLSGLGVADAEFIRRRPRRPSWPAWWRALQPPLSKDAVPIYQQMLGRLQRDLLLLLVGLTVPLGIVYGAQLAHAAFVTQRTPVGAFVVHSANVVLSLVCAVVLLRRGKLAAAWGSVVAITSVAMLLEIALLREPGLLLFGLLNLTGLALWAPLRVTVALVASLVLSLLVLMRVLHISAMEDWFSVASLFGAIMFVLACVGVVVRRVITQFAQATVAAQADAHARGQLTQRLADAQQHAARIASLEHDLRQPLRTAQGYLGTLAAEQPASIELALPALAATQISDRLLTNLLDQARAEAQPPPYAPQPTDLRTLLHRIEQTAIGLARYHTDPPVPVRVSLSPAVPALRLDAEQIERAILNLLDNALAFAPSGSMIDVVVEQTASEIWITVRDQGPGLPPDVQAALVIGEPRDSLGLGLQQVQRAVAMHGGHLVVDSSPQGTTIRLVLPNA